MRYLIIGLGIYGENLARDLTDMGHDVIGADINSTVVESLKNYLSAVYIVDSTEESQLAALPLLNVDLVIVAIGENFGASIKTVALLKKMGVKHIYARAIDTLHEAILESFELDRIITPEQRAAFDLTHELELGSAVVTMKVGDEYITVNFSVPDYFIGKKYKEIRSKLGEDYSIQLVAVCRPQEKANVLGVVRPALKYLDNSDENEAIKGDIITIFGSRKKVRELCHKLS